MTPNIDTLPTRELDVFIAENVFGRAVADDGYYVGDDGSAMSIEDYSTDPVACHALIEKMMELEMPVSISSYTKGKRFRVVFGKGFELQGKESFEDSFPLAVARAAAKAVCS